MYGNCHTSFHHLEVALKAYWKGGGARLLKKSRHVKKGLIYGYVVRKLERGVAEPPSPPPVVRRLCEEEYFSHYNN